MEEKEILEILAEAKEYIAKLITGFQKIADELKEIDATNMPDFADGVEGIICLVDLIQATDGRHTIKLDMDKLNNDLELINSKLEDRDYSGTADVILSKILPMLEEWDKGIN